MATILEDYMARKISLAPILNAGKMTLEDTMRYQELIYRIHTLETCKMLCKTAPVSTDTKPLSLHFQLVRALFSCIGKERRIGFPADEKAMGKRKTAVENLEKITTDCFKRFSSFSADSPEQYAQSVSAMVGTVLPAWIQMRNTYIPIGNEAKAG